LSPPRTIFVNARFLAEPVTGLQRFGREILRAFDAMLAEGEIDRHSYAFVLLSPVPPRDPPPLPRMELRVRGPLRSHLWEQLVLPRLARGFLLNLKNTAPIRHPNMALMVADLQVFARPQTYSPLFGKLYRWVVPRAARRARAVLGLTRNTARDVEHWLGIPADQVTITLGGHEHILRVPADGSILERHGLARKGYLLAVSSHNPNKNFAAILRALKLAGRTDYPLVIVGGSDPRVFASSPADLPSGAVLTGRVGDGELRALYENAKAFLFPSFHEGLGLPPLEAMALGCPVISSNTTSLPEVGGDAVLYFDPASDEELARAITRLLDDPDLCRDLTARGLEQAAGFTWRDSARRIWQRIQPLVG